MLNRKFPLIWLLIGILMMSMTLVACQPETPTEEATEEATEEPTDEPEPTEEPEATEEMEETEEPEEGETEPEAELGPFAECEEDLTGETITIYQQAGLTGPLATILGPGFVNGSNDAIDAINESGGVCGAMLEIDLTDTQYDPEQEVAAYEENREAEPAPLFVLTYGSGATVALAERVTEDQITNFAAGLNADSFYNPPDGYTVGVAPIYSDQFAGFMDFVVNNWDDIKPEEAGDDIVVGVIGWDSAYGLGATTDEAVSYVESLGVTVLPTEVVAVDPTADVSGQLLNLLSGGANVIYIQSLSFGPAQVIGTLHALESWDSVVVGTNNWGMNNDVLNILASTASADLANGLYGVMPNLYWNDTDEPGVQDAIAAFEAGGYGEEDRGIGYLLSYGSIYAVVEVLHHAIGMVGYENLNGQTYHEALLDLGTVDAFGLFELDVTDGNRAPRSAQIRQVQDGEFVVIEDFFVLPDTRPQSE